MFQCKACERTFPGKRSFQSHLQRSKEHAVYMNDNNITLDECIISRQTYDNIPSIRKTQHIDSPDNMLCQQNSNNIETDQVHQTSVDMYKSDCPTPTESPINMLPEDTQEVTKDT